MEKQIIEVGIEGTSPLLMNRFFEEADSKKTRKTYDDKEEADKRLYKTEQGELYQPAEHLERCLQIAGKNFKYSGRKTFLEYLKAGVIISPEAIIHKIQDWSIDKRPVVIQKARIMRCRPRLDKWQLEFQIEIYDSNISPKDINEILVYAGRFVGLGDYRPRNGRFIITKFK